MGVSPMCISIRYLFTHSIIKIDDTGIENLCLPLLITTHSPLMSTISPLIVVCQFAVPSLIIGTAIFPPLNPSASRRNRTLTVW